MRGGAPRAGTLLAEDGARLRTLRWLPDGPVRGRVLLVHGLSEHAGRWDGVARLLAGRGWAVLAYDLRGHGGAEGRRGVLGDLALLVGDQVRAREHAERVLPGEAPPVVYGHSLGGLVVIRDLQENGPDLPGVVLSAPWLATALKLPRWKRLAVGILARVAPDLTLPHEIDPVLLTRDPEAQDRRRRDPLVHHRGSAGLLAAVREAQDRAFAAALPRGLPVLLLVPGDDAVVSSEAALRWASAMSDGAVEVVELPGVRHEPQHAPEREEILGRVAGWMESLDPSRAEPGGGPRVSARLEPRPSTPPCRE